MVVLSCVLAAACTSQQREQPAPTSRSAALVGQRDYWPTAGWRTAPPARVGMDPKVLAVLDTNVAYHPQLRSLLVVRHGYASGVATAPTVVVPFWLWATRALQQADVPNRRSLPAAIALVAGSLAGAHLAAYLLTKNQPEHREALT